jgi:hypothetical protein
MYLQIPCARKGQILFCKKKQKKPKHAGSTKIISETDIIKMVENLIDNIFVAFGGPVQPTVGIPMGTNCALLGDFVPLFVRGRRHTGVSQETRCSQEPVFAHLDQSCFQ